MKDNVFIIGGVGIGLAFVQVRVCSEISLNVWALLKVLNMYTLPCRILRYLFELKI